MKQCKTCGELKSESAFYFRKERNQHYTECKNCYGKRAKKYREKHKKGRSEYHKEYYQKNRIKILNQAKKYNEVNRIKINKRRRKSHREYMRKQMENPKFRLNSNISCLINRSLKNGKEGMHWETRVDFTLDDLMNHLEKRFTAEMSLSNYGGYWEIDHIIPISAYNFDNYNHIDFKRCWALSNLRPLEKTNNIRKSNRINGFFQPSLKI